MIQWRKSDFITLGRAVSEFNKTVRRLESEDSLLNLPDVVNYKDLKSDITTRKELNRIISSLKRFQKPTQQKAIKIDSDIEITRWELTEARKSRKRAISRMNLELEGLQETLGTGNTRINEIKATIESFNKLETSSPEDFRRRVRSIFKQGTSDYEYKKALIFQQNFIEAYTKMGRKEIVKIAQKYKNPIKFWNYIKSSEFTDIKMRYDVEEGTIEYGKMTKDESYYYELNKILNKQS